MELPPEVWTLVADSIDDGSTWKSWILVCRMFSDMNIEEKILKHSNPLWSLIKKFPDADWNWVGISQNPNTTYEIVIQNLDKPFDFATLASNLKFPVDFLYEAAWIYLNWNGLNPFDKMLFQFHYNIIEHIVSLSSNLWLTAPFVRNYRNLSWNMYKVTSNICPRTIDINESMMWDADGYYDNIHHEPLDDQFDKWSQSSSLIIDLFKANLGEEWNFNELSFNPVVDVEFLRACPDGDWNWNYLSFNEDICRMFLAFPDKPWNYEDLCTNSRLELSIILKYPDRPWNIDDFSSYGNISLKQVQDNNNFAWNYVKLLENPNISFNEFISEFEIIGNLLLVHRKTVGGDMWVFNNITYDILNTEFGISYLKKHHRSVICQNELVMHRRTDIITLLEYPISWELSYFSDCPDISWTKVDNNWDFENLSWNSFNKGYNFPTEEELYKHTEEDIEYYKKHKLDINPMYGLYRSLTNYRMNIYPNKLLSSSSCNLTNVFLNVSRSISDLARLIHSHTK